jgi:DNA invertase Pin-like site-specific DNA recombinase
MIGYARVSREDQNPQYQLDALQAAGCSQVFEDRMSGAEFSRAGLDQALAALEPGRETGWGARCWKRSRSCSISTGAALASGR